VSSTHDIASSWISWSEPSPVVSYVDQVCRYKRINEYKNEGNYLASVGYIECEVADSS